MSKAYLLLENGEVFAGEGFGAPGGRVGELVFTTGMTGCAESLTDPSYAGQLLCFVPAARELRHCAPGHGELPRVAAGRDRAGVLPGAL